MIQTTRSSADSARRPRLIHRIRWPARGLFIRIGLTSIDQCVSSLGNFAVGVAVARVAGVAALGEYSLAYAMWVVTTSVHRSLITDPMAIENDVNRPNADLHVRAGLAAELVIGLAAGAAFGLVGLVLLWARQHSFGIAFITFAPFLPFLITQDYWRCVGFMMAKPAKALMNDIIFDVVQGLAFVLLVLAGERSSVLAIVAWGIGAMAGALFGLRQFSVRPTLIGGLERMRVRWSLSKWLLGTAAATSGNQQAITVLTAAILGPAGTGGFNAANGLVAGPSIMLLAAGGNIGLPEAARALHDRGWLGLRRIQRYITLAGVVSVGSVAVAVLIFGKHLLALIYGHEFARFAMTADIVALAVLVGAIRVGALLSFKVTKQTRLLYHISLVTIVVSASAAGILIPLFGVVGAAYAALASTMIMTFVQLVLHWRGSPSAADRVWKGVGSGSSAELAAEQPAEVRK